jgi:hypothetical protein
MLKRPSLNFSRGFRRVGIIALAAYAASVMWIAIQSWLSSYREWSNAANGYVITPASITRAWINAGEVIALGIGVAFATWVIFLIVRWVVRGFLSA